MSELILYKCPSCGANLKPAQGIAMLTCSFCGSVFERSLSSGEQQQISAANLTKATEKYKADLATHAALEAKALRLADEVTRLSQQDTELPMWAELITPIVIVSGGLLLIALIAACIKGVLPIVAAAALALVLLVLAFAAKIKADKLKKNADSVRSKLKSTLDDLTQARGELEKFEQNFDIDAVPAQYRSDAALDYIIGLFRSGQASKLGEAFRRYDEYSHFKNMEALQREQVAIQKKQLEIMDELADYDFDDTYDDDDFRLHDTLKVIKNKN